MKKKYTKKQIQEAINYWKKQLKLGNYKKINESAPKTEQDDNITQIINKIGKVKLTNEEYKYLINYLMNTDKLTNEETKLLIDLVMDKVGDYFSNDPDWYDFDWYEHGVDQLEDYIKLGEHTEFTFDEFVNCIKDNIIDKYDEYEDSLKDDYYDDRDERREYEDSLKY